MSTFSEEKEWEERENSRIGGRFATGEQYPRGGHYEEPEMETKEKFVEEWEQEIKNAAAHGLTPTHEPSWMDDSKITMDKGGMRELGISDAHGSFLGKGMSVTNLLAGSLKIADEESGSEKMDCQSDPEANEAMDIDTSEKKSGEKDKGSSFESSDYVNNMVYIHANT